MPAEMAGNVVETVVQAMDAEDEDGDGKLDTVELKIVDPEFLRTIGMPDASSAELLRQFDKNGDRQLDLGERQLVVGRVIPQLTDAVEAVARTEDFVRAKELNDDLVALKSSMQQNFTKYLQGKQATERSGLYNFTAYSHIKLDGDFSRRGQEVEQEFHERRVALDRQFAMRAQVLAAEMETSRQPGTALVPKPTPKMLDMRATLHHLAKQKRFDEAIALQQLLDQADLAQLRKFNDDQPAYAGKQTRKLQAQYELAKERLEQRRRAAHGKLSDQYLKTKTRLTNQNQIYKQRLENCHTKSAQPVAIVGSRPVRIAAVPTLPSLHHAATLNSEPERTRGGHGKYPALASTGGKEPGHASAAHAPAIQQHGQCFVDAPQLGGDHAVLATVHYDPRWPPAALGTTHPDLSVCPTHKRWSESWAWASTVRRVGQGSRSHTTFRRYIGVAPIRSYVCETVA